MTVPLPPRAANGTPASQGRISWTGVAFLLAGVLTIAVELSTRLILHRLGTPGFWAIVICAVYFMLWGTTELVTGLVPGIGSTAITRHRFFMPTEGRIFLLILIVVFVGSMLGRSNPLLLVFCCLAGPYVVNGFLIVTMLQGLTVSRQLPPRVMAGESFAVELRITNRKRLFPAWMITVRDRISTVTESLPSEVLFVHIARRGLQTGTYRAVIASRGHVLFGPIVMQSRFPLGLVERGLQMELAGGLLVYPRIGRLATNWRRLTEATHDSTHAAAHVSQAAESFHRLREYQSGDDPRTIHWRTSARRNELTVREFRDERDSPVTLLIDAWQPAGDNGAVNDAMELTLSFAATVCVQQLRSARDAPVALAASGAQSIEWNSAFRGDAIESLLDSLATLQASPAANWQELIAFAARGYDRRPTTLVISPRAEKIRQELPRLLRELKLERSSLTIRVMDVEEIERLRIISWG